MPLERGSSPEPSSGRASPVIRRWYNQNSGEETPNRDKAFRRYASGVDRSLSLFETALQEWADYISFLSRLLKSLQARPPSSFEIPSKIIVAKRLAQCLNPTLPAGVHQKALEVYGFIFSMIGKEMLSNDLSLYLPGLSSTLSFASLSVRTLFLELIEKYFLKIDPQSLRPALKAIILTLLPGLEDETSEDFNWILNIIDEFKKVVRPANSESLQNGHSTGDDFFWQCFFLASITSNNRRTGALAYLVRNLPKLDHLIYSEQSMGVRSQPIEHDQNVEFDRLSAIVTSPGPGLLLRCYAAGLADEQMLTQRGFLDLLVTHLPLHSKILQKMVKSEDLELLVTAAIGVVSRREMSLNRRLWAWLIGPQPNEEPDGGADSSYLVSEQLQSHVSRTRYFEKFGLYPLTQALLKIINCDSVNPSERARPFRICLSLMDRWEIGGLLVTDIFLPIVDSTSRYKSQATSKAEYSEVLRSASVFFDGVESGLIWGEILQLITQAVNNGKLSTSEKITKISLVNFIITQFNVQEEEMLLVHAPLTLLAIIVILEDARESDQIQSLDHQNSKEVSNLALQLAIDLIELIPERSFRNRPLVKNSSSTIYDHLLPEDLANNKILEKISTFYVQEHGNLDACHPPYTPLQITELLLQKADSLTRCTLRSSSSSIGETAHKAWLHVNILSKTPKIESYNASGLLSAMASSLSADTHLPFLVLSSINYLATSLYSSSYISMKDLSGLVGLLVRHSWYYMSASNPKYHVEAVRTLWQLQAALSTSNHDIEAAICSIIIETNLDGTYTNQNSESGRKFGVLWTHTLHDNPTNADRRSSKVSRLESRNETRFSSVDNFEIIISRPLFLLLDALLDERTQLFMTVRIWLQNLTSIHKLFHVFVTKLSGFSFLHKVSGHLNFNVSDEKLIHRCDNDLDQCLYYLRTLSNVLRWSSESMWSALTSNNIPTQINLILGIDEHDRRVTILDFFLDICLKAIQITYDRDNPHSESQVNQFHRTSLNLLHQILLCPHAPGLADLRLEKILIERLMQSLDEADSFIQVLLLNVVFAALKLLKKPEPKLVKPSGLEIKRNTATIQDVPPKLQSMAKTDINELTASTYSNLPPNLIKCIQAGLSAPSSRSVLDSWMSFITECLQFYEDDVFQIIIPLVETFCSQISKTFFNLQKIFRKAVPNASEIDAPESTLISLLNGLEHVLERGHDLLIYDESKTPNVKSPDQPHGFFGNIVSGVFTSETPQSRSITANHRLTVLLTFQDAVKICYVIWSWGGDDFSAQDIESASSFNYTSLRMRNRARRLLEHMFAAEPHECLETMVGLWRKSSDTLNQSQSSAFFNLLHVLDGSRPKHTIPAIFNAINSRTNPSALEPSRMPTLTSSINDTDLTVFLIEYSQTLEDDAMDEIWEDCMSFLKDLLSNPFPHRQVLPCLLEFAAILGEKVDNTNFGEQIKMRRELGVRDHLILSKNLLIVPQDLFIRLLTAVFTTRPMGFLEAPTKIEECTDPSLSRLSKAEDVVAILAEIAPKLPKILVEPDRILNAANTICSCVIGPTFKSKSFPASVSKSILQLLNQIAKLPQNQKLWKKDLADAFYDPRFFTIPVDIVNSDWFPILKQWLSNDKERMPELLSRLMPPATAGIVFGVGATSIRHEADRKAQLNLRRIATLILAAADDNFVKDLPLILEKIVELLSATATSSPSSITRAEIYLLLRSLVLKTSTVHLANFWPIINAELHPAISSILIPEQNTGSDTYNNYSILQACKLLDVLLCIAPEDFLLHEWLYITDTIDAVHRPSESESVALIDILSEELGSKLSLRPVHPESVIMNTKNIQSRRPLLGMGGIDDCKNWEKREDLVSKVLRPFFSQLSIFVFENTYSMCISDRHACWKGLLEDLFDDRSIVKAL
ncbi:Protein dopey [Golovinomyces cichoracearum]|uniref:Protein dopey n=1 Tax=Golovinomyces cichoracearum TaxID=62708 RepID=A0A420IPF5_9PEZI|nr:Protein dopey [Golovinomyces cichoracearum]